MSFDDRHSYEISLKYYRDFINSLNTAEKKGMERGIEKGIEKGIKQGIEVGEKQAKIYIAKKSLSKGIDIETISLITGLSKNEIEEL